MNLLCPGVYPRGGHAEKAESERGGEGEDEGEDEGEGEGEGHTMEMKRPLQLCAIAVG